MGRNSEKRGHPGSLRGHPGSPRVPPGQPKGVPGPGQGEEEDPILNDTFEYIRILYYV